MIGTTVNDRYQIEEKIGKGGMGTVYRAQDKTLKRDVALKLLTSTRMGTEGRARMLREAQTVARLNHPNIVTVFDAGEHEENPYIIMELVVGHTLAENSPTELDEIIVLVRQICAALTHAHEEGIIHRDLKPENIIVQPDGVLKLMDFGLARSVTSRMTEEGTIMGTVHYMSPEQALGNDVDHRTDLYALGALLYEFTTGSLPFEADDAIAIISQHINVPVVPPRAKNENIPYYLDYLIQQLLSKDPAERPQSAAEVVEALEVQGTSAKEQEEELSVLDRISRGRMIGRSTELREAQTLWQKASSGQGQLLLISGEPGIGKTRFAKEIITNAEISGGLVLRGASYAEGGMPYSAFRQVLRKGLRSNAGKKLELPHEILKDLLTLAPELRSSYPDLKDAISSELPDPQQLWEHFIIFINMLSAEAPILLVIEDIHWSDSGSLALARQLARQTRENAVMLLYNYREVEIHENRAFHNMLLDFNREHLGKRIKLIRLDKEHTHEMLYALLHEEITDELLEGIYRETEGHPFFIEEVITALVKSERLYYKDGRWHRPSIEELGIPQSIQVAIQSRLDQLPNSAHDLLRQAAIFGREFDLKMLKQASKLDELELIDILELSESAQIVEEIESDTGDPSFAFMHALIPTTLVEDTRTLKRRVLHRRAAESIEQHHPGNLQALAYHLTEAGELEKAVAYHLQLADRARSLQANQEAINSYQQALDYFRETGETDKTRDTLFKLALTQQNNFEFEASQQAYDEAFAMVKQADAQLGDMPPAPHALRHYMRPPRSIDIGAFSTIQTEFSLNFMFSGLLKMLSDGNLVPHLAQRWEIEDKGKRYIFHLCPDLKWSDGEPLTAHDFEYGWKRALNPVTELGMVNILFVIKNAEAYYTGLIDDPSLVGVCATDDLTLEVNLEQPTGYFLLSLIHSHTFAQPRHVIEKYGLDWVKTENYTCSGPFMLKSWDINDRMVLVRNPHYFLPFSGNLESIEIAHRLPNESCFEAYQENEIDVARVEDFNAGELKRARHSHTAEIRTSAVNSVYFITFDCTASPFDNLLVRRAFALALDKDNRLGSSFELVNQSAHGGMIPPKIAGHNRGIGYQFDPVKARRLLADAGYPNGEGFPPIHFIIRVDLVIQRRAAYYCKQWAEVLNVEVSYKEDTDQKFTDASVQRNKHDARYSLSIIGWILDYPDPHNVLMESPWLLGSGWQNKQFNDLIKAAKNNLDQQARIQLYQQADKLVIEECPVIPTAYGVQEFLFKPWVKNYYLDPTMQFNDPTAAVIEPHD